MREYTRMSEIIGCPLQHVGSIPGAVPAQSPLTSSMESRSQQFLKRVLLTCRKTRTSAHGNTQRNEVDIFRLFPARTELLQCPDVGGHPGANCLDPYASHACFITGGSLHASISSRPMEPRSFRRRADSCAWLPSSIIARRPEIQIGWPPLAISAR
jgi:hypothetical protein